MTGNLQAIGFLLSWVLLWCLGAVALESVLGRAGLLSSGNSSVIVAVFVLAWTAAISLGGWALFNRITREPGSPLCLALREGRVHGPDSFPLGHGGGSS